MPRKTRRAPVSRDKRFKKHNLLPDSGPPERWQHSPRATEFTEAAGIFAARALHEHVLDKLFTRKFLSAAEREAGLLLHQGYHEARIEARISASLEPVRAGTRDHHTRYERNPKQEQAYKRWRTALKASAAEHRDILIHVCCVGCWPALEQLAKLKEALGRLARHYGLRG